MENLINIIEKLKISSKTKVSTEIEMETIDDFCKKYNCEFHHDSTNDTFDYNYLTHDNKQITLIVEDILKYSWLAWEKLIKDVEKYIKEFNNNTKYQLNIRKNNDAKLIVIDCEGPLNKKYHLFGSITLATNKKISESIDKKNDTKNVEMLLVKIADYILSIWNK